MSNLNDFNREAKAALRVALQWLLLAVPTGLVCGAVGTAFHLSVEYVTELRATQSWLLLCLPLAGLAIVALYKVTKCEGVGTNNVIRAVQSGEPVSLLLVPAIFLGTVLTHLCGGSAGREGAALQMGGSIGWNVGKLLHLSDYVRRTATISGMAAFFSALFGTPLTAALLRHDGGGRGADVHFGLYARVHFGPHCLRRIPVLRDRPDQFCAQFHPAPDAGNRASDRPAGHCLCRRDPAVLLDASHPGARDPQADPESLAPGFCGRCSRSSVLVSVRCRAVQRGRNGRHCRCRGARHCPALGFCLQDLPDRPDPGSRLQRRRGGPKFLHRGTFGCIAGPWLGLPAGFAGAIGLVCVFCGATNALIPSILLGFELFGGQGLELIALGCGVCYMLSGHHGLYSSQTFVTNKLRPEYASHKWRVKLKKKEE